MADARGVVKGLAQQLGGRVVGETDILVHRDGVPLSIRLSRNTVGIDGRMLPDAARPPDQPRVDGRPRLGMWLEGGSDRLGKRLTVINPKDNSKSGISKNDIWYSFQMSR